MIRKVQDNQTISDTNFGPKHVQQFGVKDKEHHIDAKWCLVGSFLSDWVVDFPCMQQTLEALWKPGKGVYIKGWMSNLILFQFYHEIDIKRKALKEGENLRCVALNKLDKIKKLLGFEGAYTVDSQGHSGAITLL
ncbi:hypothetical protein POM88_022953 [Heracleum sosnowskyi]|uniref:DUF4283 domain-containing protein n=1 Tax=Heracleum sosnowskyi TaxID=360622 RepID=A0AAD8MVD8_9APIA|nr:hypothetical protein POM88_022953 [Heracleum sosnowskyi]